MNAKKFFMTVVAMRIAQKMYIDTDSDEWLENAMKLEKEIDLEIERVQLILKEKEKEKKNE